jgi:hypothetical protein
MNEGFPSKGEQSPTNIDLPYDGHQRTPKNGTIWAIEHAFVWHIIYKQGVISVNIRISKKKNVKVIVQN